jgi:hypothetical protein
MRFSQYVRMRCVFILVGLSLVVPMHSADAQNAFTDGFNLKPFWTIVEQNGKLALVSDVTHAGNLALRLTSASGGQRYIWVAHTFPTPKKGTVSVWFYDTGAGTETLYAGIYANYDDSRGGPSLNVADWNATHYVWAGPGVGETPTSVARTNGWHEFKLELTPTAFNAYIDRVLVGSIPGDFSFNNVRLQLSGPFWRPNATFYFDDFRFRALP